MLTRPMKMLTGPGSDRSFSFLVSLNTRKRNKPLIFSLIYCSHNKAHFDKKFNKQCYGIRIFLKSIPLRCQAGITLTNNKLGPYNSLKHFNRLAAVAIRVFCHAATHTNTPGLEQYLRSGNSGSKSNFDARRNLVRMRPTALAYTKECC
jgi:hypothetical protein